MLNPPRYKQRKEIAIYITKHQSRPEGGKLDFDVDFNVFENFTRHGWGIYADMISRLKTGNITAI
jgi:hypothetical protein